jgi:hypothetical protein
MRHARLMGMVLPANVRRQQQDEGNGNRTRGHRLKDKKVSAEFGVCE